jgi:hypothetical protein
MGNNKTVSVGNIVGFSGKSFRECGILASEKVDSEKTKKGIYWSQRRLKPPPIGG